MTELGVKRPRLVTLAHGVPLFRALADQLDLDTATEIMMKLSRRVGEEPLEELGHGGWGVAYRLPSGRVLKATSDLAEMDAAATLLGVHDKNLIRIYDVFAVDAGGGGSTAGPAVGFIVRDWVETTLDEERPDLAAVLTQISQVADLIYADFEAKGRKEAASRAQADFIERLSEAATRMGEPLLWDIVSAAERLRRLGLLGHYFHGRNVGLVNVASGEPTAVVFDFGRLVRKPRRVELLGAAEAPQEEPDPLLERLVHHPLVRRIHETTQRIFQESGQKAAEEFMTNQWAAALERFTKDPEILKLIEEAKRLRNEGKVKESERLYDEAISRVVDFLTSVKMRRWTITVESPGGIVDSSVHMREKDAETHARMALQGVISRAEFQLEVFRDSLTRHFEEYYNAALDAIDHAKERLAANDVWGALAVWEDFQEVDARQENGGEVGPPPIWRTAGRVSVKVD